MNRGLYLEDRIYMTDDERKLLSDLADKIAATPTPPKDPEAEQFIRTRIGSRPDALYLMTQTVLIQNLALQQAQAQLQQYKQASGNQVAPGGSFLGQTRPAASGQQYSSNPQYAAPQYASPQPQYAPAQGPSAGMFGQGSFLRGAAQTAAGVAAGALAFEGIESLFHHGGGGGGLFGGGGIGGYAPSMEETVVENNYYGNAGEDRGDYGRDNYGDQGRDDYQATDDAANQYDDNSGGYDDGGGLDDGGGFDSGGGDNFA
ncbi:MAG TPA: DUF2076 family protein [Bryobacteraceae bacterium]|nr:DUF2076 family protein [Bryobacteraceae bacterium]